MYKIKQSFRFVNAYLIFLGFQNINSSYSMKNAESQSCSSLIFLDKDSPNFFFSNTYIVEFEKRIGFWGETAFPTAQSQSPKYTNNAQNSNTRPKKV